MGKDGPKWRKESETWPGVCLAVTLSKARGAEQPNYDLRPVPWSPAGPSVPPLHSSPNERAQARTNNERKQHTQKHTCAHRHSHIQTVFGKLSVINSKGLWGDFKRPFLCSRKHLCDVEAGVCLKDNSTLTRGRVSLLKRAKGDRCRGMF